MLPHDIILMTSATATAGTLAAALSRLGTEHHKNGDVPDHDYAMLVTSDKVPAHWQSGKESWMAEAHIAALRSSPRSNFAGIGSAQAIVVHMAGTHH
jgi:hypothetical protein